MKKEKKYNTFGANVMVEVEDLLFYKKNKIKSKSSFNKTGFGFVESREMHLRLFQSAYQCEVWYTFKDHSPSNSMTSILSPSTSSPTK